MHLYSYGSPVVEPGESHQEEALRNKDLLDRIRNLEAQLAIAKLEGTTNPPPPVPNAAPKRLGGIISKTRFLGGTHWMYSHGAFDDIAYLFAKSTRHPSGCSDASSEQVDDITESMEKCKALAKSMKAIPYSQWLANPCFRDAVPVKGIADQLVNAYFRTSESIYRILHIPSFMKEYRQYWDQPDVSNPVFIVKLLLVMSIGGCFYQGPDSTHYRVESKKWIFAAQSWLSTPFEKAKLHMSTIQIQCLLIIARQYCSISGDVVWIAAGTLLRTAMQMGFHRDPASLPKIGILQGEMRRRLWATIIELNIQSSIGSGMPFLITEQEWDTAPPANIDDVEISEATNNPSLQSQDRVTQLNINMVDLPLRLALLLLHRPFAAKGMKDPRFYYSRKICLESAVTILKYPSSEPLLANQSVDNMFRDDYAQLKIVGGGFKSIITYTSTIIFHELHTQLKEDGPAMVQQTKDNRDSLKQCLLDLLDLSVDRVTLEENNVMVRLLIVITLSLLDSTEKGVDPEPVVLDAAKKSSLLCYNLMSARMAETNASLPVEAGSHNALDISEDPLGFGMDFTMQNFGDQDIQGSWLKFACDDGVLWH
ncbi:hypothetical protein VE04_03240 [Pseudogymnoascus sp. 24MN13]|nr:hypothetical protein VE04_03240 [Pseudogymnoascus sp. 24MN13]